MEFSLGGLEELYTDGVLNPRTASGVYQENFNKYRELADRVYLLYCPEKSAASSVGAEFDIVLLHGIGSDEFKCWTNEKGVLWPAVFLPQDFPTARVLTVGYAHSLFVWKTSDASNAGAEEASMATAAPQAQNFSAGKENDGLGTTATASGVATATEAGGVFHDLKALAKRAEKVAADSVSGYAPDGLSNWLLRPSGKHRAVANTKASLTVTGSLAQSEAPSFSYVTSAAPQPSSSTDPKANCDSHIQLLSGIRDTAESPMSLRDRSSVHRCASSTKNQNWANEKRATPVRDPRSMQSLHMVAAELAERLLSPAVGVGQRPVVFMVHSMGGLVLKEMILSLFEATRPAPSSVVGLSVVPSDDRDFTEKGTGLRSINAVMPQANTLLRAVRGIVFYSTPHFGSAMASVIAGLRKYYQGLGGLAPTSVVTGLGDHNREELIRLNDRFLDVVDRLGSELSYEDAGAATVAAAHDTETVKSFVEMMELSLTSTQTLRPVSDGSLYSSRSLKDARVGSQGAVCILSFGETEKLNGVVRVVEPESANLAPGDPRCSFHLIKADHTQINRPISKTSPSYAMLYGFLDRMQQRGFLADSRDRAARVAPPIEAVSSDLPSMSGVRGLTAVEVLSRQYEAEWVTLFDPEKLTRESVTGGDDAAATGLYPPLAPADGQRLRVSECRAAAYKRGLGEVRLALPLLEDSLIHLQQLLHRLFGVATASPLDSLSVVAADMREFLQGFYSHERLIAMVAIDGEGSSDAEKKNGFHESVLVDEVVSFRVPLQLVTYWARQAVRLLRVFEQTKEERSLRVGSGGDGPAGSSASPVSLWEIGGVTVHPISHDLRELREVEHNVSIVREEWENFRRYASLRVRAAKCDANAKPIESLQSRLGRGISIQTMDRKGVPVSEHIAVLFFARAIRVVVSDRLHEGGALGGLLGAYLRSALLQVRGVEQHLPPAQFDNPWLPLLQCASPDATSIFSAVLEGLELSLPSSRVKQRGNIPANTSNSRVSLMGATEMRAITPSLTATSAMLLGFFSLYVDELDRLGAGAGGWTSVRHFQVAEAALGADVRVRSQLLRAASRAIQSERVAANAADFDSAQTQKPRGAQWDWSRRVWRLTSARAERSGPTEGFPAEVAGDFAEERCRCHVASLDDGLFLSAMQLVAASFECSILLDGWQAQALLRGEGVGTSTIAPLDKPAVDIAALSGSARGEQSQSDLVSMGPELARGVRAAHKAYERTSKILKGLTSADMEQPFVVSETPKAERVFSAEEDTATEEESAKDRFRDLLRGFLHKLKSDDVREGSAVEGELYSSRPFPGSVVGRAMPSLTWASTKLPIPKAQRQACAPGSVASTANVLTKPKFSGCATSLSNLMKSFAEAWEAVRRGGTAIETPEYFAYNAMVMWWVVEREALALLRVPAAAALTADGDRWTPELNGLVSPRSLRGALVDTEKAWQNPYEATADVSSLSALNHAADGRAAERQCWTEANTALRCRWLTLCGGDEFLRTLHARLEEDRCTLRQLEASAFENKPRETGELFVSPAKEADIDKARGGQLAIPKALLDAVREDDRNAELHCWLGHCYTTHRVASLDAVHAYLQTIFNDRSRSRVFTAVAEVGLAWSHIHQVPCNSLQLWQMTRAPGPATTTSSITDTAGLLSYRVSSVLDTSALHSAPVALHRFYHDAILHHVRTVERYRRGSLAGTLDPSISLECHFSPTASRTLFSTRFHPSASARHLRLAEEGFQRALRLDPMSVGALCGLGRLRSLYSSSVGGGGVGAPMGEALGEPIGSRIPSWFPFRDAAEQSHTGPGGGAADPCSYFRAALQAAASRQVSALSACTSRAGCLYAMEPIWCSYAAYWMSEECWRIAPVKEAFSVTPGATAVYASVAKWLRRSLQLYPRNDWALTSLGLLYFEPSVSLHPHLMRDETEGARSVVTIGSDLDLAEMSRLRGLALLQRALAINPTNTWALWGVGTYGKSTPGRDACQRLLRHLIVKSIRRP